MADQVITKQELIDAQKDAQTLEDVINGPSGELIKTRLGREVYTLASVPQINTMTREEVVAAVTPKANKADVDTALSDVGTALSNLSTAASKYYSTLAEANQYISSIGVNQLVYIGSYDGNEGLYYRASPGATSLTKSAYDPLIQSKTYTDSKLGSRLLKTTNLDTLESGNYFISSSDLLSIINDGTYITLGYPTGITALGGAKINVVKESDAFVYQTIELTRQGLSFYRQGTGVADTFYDWISDVSAAIAEANKNPKFNPNQRSIGVITTISTSDTSKTSIFEYTEGRWDIPRTTVLTYSDAPIDSSIHLMVEEIKAYTGSYFKYTAHAANNKTYVAYKDQNNVVTSWQVAATENVIDSKVSAYDAALKAANPLVRTDTRRKALINQIPNSGGNTAIIQYAEGYHNIQRTKVLTFADRPEDATLMLEVSLLNTANNGYYFFKAETVTGNTYTRHSMGGVWQGAWKKIASTQDIADAITAALSNISIVKSDPDNCVIGLGSSSMAYMETKLRELVRSKGREYIGGGFAATHAQTLAMFCGYGTYYMNFATDTVLQNDIEYDITWTNAGDFGMNTLNPVGSLTKWWVTLDNGVRGQVVFQTGKFTPKNLSEPLTVSGAIKVLPNLARYKRSISIIQTAKNNLQYGSASQTQNAKNSYDEIVRQIELVQPDSRYIVLGHHVNRDVTEAVRSGVLEVNTYLENKYKNRYVDIQNWLMSSKLWTDLGITPTSADTEAQASGWIPPSVSSDGVHLDTFASDYYVDNFIVPKLVAMGYI
ncbi:hypothetical protein [Acinetobacter sp. BMW17]|uniref:hypothetical protein n=1 Tax=Acinetobacter sp. BMW17 TaxID=1795629 RepID=UPI000784BF31|nr:hypothetical protein [Acinetobacter sp. BMW17]